MNDPRDPAFRSEPAPGPDEALSAYLLGELDDAEAAAFERRLAADPALAARLDALAGALVALGGVDEVGEPEGFAARLDARLDAERAAPDLDARRRRQRWSAVLTAAAGVAVLAVAGLQVLGTSQDLSTTQGMEMAQDAGEFEEAGLEDSAAAEQFAPESAEGGIESLSVPAPTPHARTDAYRAADGDEREGADDAAAGEAGNAGGGGSAPSVYGSTVHSGPLLVDDGAELRADEELRARFVGAPESERLRGMRRDEAAETAVRHEGMVRNAGPFASGVRPDACLDEVRGGPDARVVARVESLRWQGGEALAYVIGLPGPGAGQVDRFELWLVGPQGCDTRRFLTWE